MTVIFFQIIIFCFLSVLRLSSDNFLKLRGFEKQEINLKVFQIQKKKFISKRDNVRNIPVVGKVSVYHDPHNDYSGGKGICMRGNDRKGLFRRQLI